MRAAVLTLFTVGLLAPAVAVGHGCCKAWCADDLQEWDLKCTWKHCGGCEPCPPPSDPAPWTTAEALDVAAKLVWVFEKPRKAFEAMAEARGPADCYTGFPSGTERPQPCDGANGNADGDVGSDLLPYPAKFVRLAFHDCMAYADGAGGCDGCLKFYDQFMNYNDLAAETTKELRRPDPVAGTNNGRPGRDLHGPGLPRGHPGAGRVAAGRREEPRGPVGVRGAGGHRLRHGRQQPVLRGRGRALPAPVQPHRPGGAVPDRPDGAAVPVRAPGLCRVRQA